MEKQIIYIFGASEEHEKFLKGEKVSAVKIGQTTYRENEDPYVSVLNRVRQETRTGLSFNVMIYKVYVFPVKTTSKVDDRFRSYLDSKVIPGIRKSSEIPVGEFEIAAGKEWVYDVNAYQIDFAAKALCSEYVEFEYDYSDYLETENETDVISSGTSNQVDIWKDLVRISNWTNIKTEDNGKNWRNTDLFKSGDMKVQMVASICSASDTLTVTARFPNTPEGAALAEQVDSSYRVNSKSIIVSYKGSLEKGAEWIYNKTLEIENKINSIING